MRFLLILVSAAVTLASTLPTASGQSPRAAQPAPRPAAAAPPLTLQDLQDVVRLADLAWARDGASLAFTVTPLLSGPSRTGSDVWLVEPGRAARALTRDAEPDRAGDFNPSGTHLSLASRRDGDAVEQGWLWDRHDGALRPLAKIEGGLLTPPSWAPDASSLAAIARSSAPGSSAGAVDGAIWLLEPGGGKARAVEGAPAASALAWSPTANVLAVVAGDADRDADGDGRRGLALLQFEGVRARVRFLPSPPRGDVVAEPPVWSPRGTHIAARVSLSADRHELRVWDVAAKTMRVVSLPLHDRFGPPVWSSEGASLLVPLRDGLRVHVAELRIAGNGGGGLLASDDSLAVRPLTSGLECAGRLELPRALAVSGDGRQVAFVRASPRSPDEIFLLAEPQPRKLTAFHTQLLRKGLGSVEAATLPAPAGPRPALLTYPAAAVAPEAPWPVLIVADGDRGGAAATASTAAFDPTGQLASSAGYLVLRAEWPAEATACADTAAAALAELRRRGLATGAPARWVGSDSRVRELVRAGKIPADSLAFPMTESLDRRTLERWWLWLRAAAER